ncbi:MAG: sulfate ABC transporter permease subunit CysW [Pseudanabaenaceae cyanobacterium]
MTPRVLIKYSLIVIALSYLGILVVVPLINIFYQATAEGWQAYWQGITTPEALHAITLTLTAVGIAVPLNTVFGLIMAWVLARQNFWGKQLLVNLLDLPLAISPIVVGLMIVLLYSPTVGLFKDIVNSLNWKIIFALPGIVLTTTLVTVPFVVKEVTPALQAIGREEEEVAKTLGADGWQIFWRVTLPNIRWSLLYGVILCTARALGEFGAVSVVSGKIIGETNTLTLHIERMYAEYQTISAFACATLLTLISIVTLIAQELLHRWDQH